ncbi:Esterase PHB depolymerase [Paenibacillus sophorae]|uniref:Esterase PHB depolymerase n=1 Tax=Paenibacillus sophorae TaxID=1333845 RepID=A0A1H8UGV6_9BACL|nr:hypothetical protein [Paenibacillus sophorae]QWU13141.1 hypothetical protein KP014_13995 [Paenibacillus sophorae]SEP02114.1 Esterase PHB depolymerase [Paenibacillus sophorae]
MRKYKRGEIFIFVNLGRATACLDKKAVRLQAAYVIGPVQNPADNDKCNSDLYRIFKKGPIDLENRATVSLADGRSSECRFHCTIGMESLELDLTGYELKEGERMFLVANINSAEVKKIYVRPFDVKGKIWINGELLYNDSGPFRYRLQQGDNTVVIEYAEVSKHYSIRIRDTNLDRFFNEELIGEFMEQWIENRVCVVHETANALERTRYEFYLLSCDAVGVPNGSPAMIIVMNDDGDVVDRFETAIGRKVVYDTAGVKNRTRTMLHIQIEYADLGSRFHEKSHVILVHPLGELIESMELQAEELERTDRCSADDLTQLAGLLERLRAVNVLETNKLTAKRLCLVKEYKRLFFGACGKLLEGRSYENAIAEQRLGDGFFRSKLDDSIERYTVLLPSDYSEQRTYPLIIFLPVGRYELDLPDFRDRLYAYWNLEAIAVTFSCRGVTMGSYVGEAAFLEGLDVITQRFRVDEDKIYLSGYSNGAYAAWALSQAYPDRFAGIAAYSGGADPDKLINLSNMAVLNVCGEEDYAIETSYTKPSEVLGGDDYKGILEPDSNHWDTPYFHHQLSGIRWLLQHKRRTAPRRIHFRTDKARHRKCFWVEIEEFAEGSHYGEIVGEWIRDTTILIQTIHIGQFELTLPDSVKIGHLEVIIDGQQFTVQPGEARGLRFRKSGDVFVWLPPSFALAHDGITSNGMGIMDVYMDQVRIVVPDRYSSEQERLDILKVSDVFANPKTDTWDTNIYVHYPILQSSRLTDEDAARCNLICIATGVGRHDFLSRIVGHLRIGLHADGFTADAGFEKGDYCILFIQPNPMNPAKKLLTVFANNSAFFKRNIYTRKLIIPSYFSGFHPYLNKEVILFNGKLRAMELKHGAEEHQRYNTGSGDYERDSDSNNQ